MVVVWVGIFQYHSCLSDAPNVPLHSEVYQASTLQSSHSRALPDCQIMGLVTFANFAPSMWSQYCLLEVDVSHSSITIS